MKNYRTRLNIVVEVESAPFENIQEALTWVETSGCYDLIDCATDLSVENIRITEMGEWEDA